MSEQAQQLSKLTMTDVNETVHGVGMFVYEEDWKYYASMERIYAAARALAVQKPEDARQEAEELGIVQYSRAEGLPQRTVESYWALVKDHAAGSDGWMEAVLTHGPLVQGEAGRADSALRAAIETAAGQLRAERTAALVAAQARITSELAKLQQTGTPMTGAEERPNAWAAKVRGVCLGIESGFMIAVEDIAGWVTEIEDDSRMVWVVTANGQESPVITFPMEPATVSARKPAGPGPRVVPSFTEALLPYADEDGYINPHTVDRYLWRMLDF